MESYVKVYTGKFKMQNDENIYFTSNLRNFGKPTYADTKKANLLLITRSRSFCLRLEFN